MYIEKIKVLSLFSGIGAFEKALENIRLNWDLVGFSEIDKYAIKSYCAIHGVDESLNLGDITQINTDDVSPFDLLVGGSPCQNISIMRKTAVGSRTPEGLNGEESKLFFDYVRILDNKLPKYFVFENVRNLLSSNNGKDFKTVIELLGENYNIHYQLMNSCDYEIPQIRRRLFIVGKRRDLGDFDYEFPNPIQLKLTVQDLLEPVVDDKYYLTDKMYKTVMSTGTKGWYAKPETDCKVAKPLVRTMHKMHRASTDNYYHTEYKPNNKTNLRRLTPLECFRLQGFSDEDYQKVRSIKMSDTQMYMQTGNSITVKVLEHIFRNLFCLDSTF